MKPAVLSSLKSICLTLFMAGLLVVQPAWAVPAPPPVLDQLEQQLFSHTYSGEPEQARIDRLETVVFGNPVTNMPMPQRISKLGQFLANPARAQVPQQQMAPATPGPQTPAHQNIGQGNNPASTMQPAQPMPNEDSYPAVSQMERKLFNKSFESDSLEVRLGRIEKKTMGQVQIGTLQERTDQMRLLVLGDTGNGPAPQQQQMGQGYNPPPAYTDPDNIVNGSNINNANSIVAGGRALGNVNPYIPGSAAQANPSNGYSPIEFQKNNANQGDVAAALPALEKKLLHNTYPMDSVDNRLSRLEKSVFNSTAPELAPDERIYRLVSVLNAKDTASHDPYMARGGMMGGRGGSQSAAAGILPMVLFVLMSFL